MKLFFDVPDDTEVVFFNFTYGNGERYGQIITDGEDGDVLYNGAEFVWDDDARELI